MKKIVALMMVLVVCTVVLCACQVGNRQIGWDTTQQFSWAMIQLGNGELIEGPVTSWRDFDDGDEVQLVIHGKTYLTHYSNVILVTEKP